MDEVVSDLSALASFLTGADPRLTLDRVGKGLRLTLPDAGGTILVEWEERGLLHLRMLVGIAGQPHLGAVMELLSDTNSTLGILGFVLHRPSGVIEYRLTVFRDPAGAIASRLVGEAIVTAQQTVATVAPQIAALCRDDDPEIPAWWAE